VSFTKIQTPGHVTGGGAIGEDEFLAEFKVKLDKAGCYAMLVKLRAYTRLPNLPFFDTDQDVAYPRGATVKCHCFKAVEERSFYVTGNGTAPKGKEPLKPEDAHAEALEPLQGAWPKSDWPFNNLELYVTVRVVRCKMEECSTDAGCGIFDTNDDDDDKNVVVKKSDRQKDAHIEGGPSPKEDLKELVEKALEQGAGAAKPK
jgi:hypothetical protein